LPEPFLPTNAYRLPAFRRSFALLKTSVPSAAVFPLPLPFTVFSPALEVTVILRPSMSSYFRLVPSFLQTKEKREGNREQRKEKCEKGIEVKRNERGVRLPRGS
jgi:hypothetical protein